MSSPVSLENTVTLRQAFLIMHVFLEKQWELAGRPGEIGGLLGTLSLWETESGGKEPMDAGIFPEWLECAQAVLKAEVSSEGYREADALVDGKLPATKVRR